LSTEIDFVSVFRYVSVRSANAAQEGLDLLTVLAPDRNMAAVPSEAPIRRSEPERIRELGIPNKRRRAIEATVAPFVLAERRSPDIAESAVTRGRASHAGIRLLCKTLSPILAQGSEREASANDLEDLDCHTNE